MPQVEALASSLDEMRSELENLRSELETSKAEYSALNVKYSKLTKEYDSLKSSYDALNHDYEYLKTDYDELKSKYVISSIELGILKNLTYVFVITTIAFIATTAYFAKKPAPLVGMEKGKVIEEVPVSKPKRKTWKVILLTVILILVVSTIGTYVYVYNALGDTLSESFGTIYVSNARLTNISLVPPSADGIIDYTINNPTGTSIRLERVSFEIWIDGKSIGTLTAIDKILPAGGSTVLTATFHMGSELVEIMNNPPVTMKVSGEVVGSTNILFLTVTRTYTLTKTQIIS